MAEVKSPSTKDLLLLILGLQVPKTPPANADSGDVYWLNEITTEDERTLRDSQLNSLWLSSPEKAWEGVRFRDWLIATLIRSLADNKNEFVALSEPLLASIDLLGKEFTRDMNGVTDAIKQALETKGGDRALFNTLSIGLSRHVHDGKEVFLLGAGMRRRARYWKLGQDREALQADVEFLVPFYILPSQEEKDPAFHNYSICAGVALSRKDGGQIGKDENGKELVSARFNLRVPFGTRWKQRFKSNENDLETFFGDPEIKIEKRIRENDIVSGWQKFSGWKQFVTTFSALPECQELLNVPIGPLLLEKVSDPSGIGDIILKQKKRDEIKRELIESKEEFKETIKFLENIKKWEPPDKEKTLPTSGNRKLGNLLDGLGFMTSKGPSGGDYEYKFEVSDKLTTWDVVNRIFKELDGYPLWVKGATPKSDKEMRAALTLASQAAETEENKQYFGLAGLFYNIPLKTVSEEDAKKEKDSETPAIVVSKENFTKDEGVFIEEDEEEDDKGEEEKSEEKPKDKPKSTVEVFLHLGKWLSGETLDDNWFQRLLPPGGGPLKGRVPIPGIRLLPIKRTQNAPEFGNKDAVFSWTFRADLVSLGIDIKGATKDGLTFLQGFAGHFGLGAIEIRLALKVSAEDMSPATVADVGREKEWFERFSVGVGIKLKDLRLSFGPKEEEKKKEKTGHDIIDGLGDVLGNDWVALPAPKKPEDKKVRTRLSAKKKDKFSISVGYLSPLTKGSHGTLDIQLYDEKGNRGKMVIIPIDRQAPLIYVRQIGIGLKGVENLELAKGLPDSAQLTVSITGGIRFPVFELGMIGAKLTFPLNNPSAFKFSLDGLDISIKIGDIVISGAFFKSGIEYAGMLTVDHPKASFAAMGFYGSLRELNIAREKTSLEELNRGEVPKKLKEKLIEKKITPADSRPIRKTNVPDEWELKTADGKRYTISDDDDKLNVLRPDKTFFIYAMLTAGSGGGPTFGPIQFNGIALGYGYNRKLILPKIDKVAEFPLVQMVMGEGGYQKDDTSLDVRTQLGKPLEDPVSMLEKFKDHVVAEAGQQFACGGARFTIGGLVDCFALIVVQWNEKSFEIALLGLARFRHTRDLTAKAICYVEMQLLLTLKPSEGTFQLQAQLTTNSWILTTDCKLTGGFALFIWFGGEHKGDWVFTLGGYHPRFKRPEHYPTVPRLGLNWPVNNNLTIKGGLYFAVTPACLMVGARLEATFHSGRISAWFTAYLDVVVNWDPVYFEAELGISLRVEASFFLTSIKVTIAASIQMWGPPVGGIAHIDLTLCSFDIDFGEKRPEKVELIKTWEKFCHKFLNMTGADDRALANPIKAFPIVQPNLAGGRNNASSLPTSRQQKPEDKTWIVRADELELAATAAVPLTTMNLGRVNSEGVQNLSFSGQPVMVTKPVVLEDAGLSTRKSTNKYGAHPMGKTVDSVLNVTVVRDDVSGTHAEELSGWSIEEERSSLPAALWNSEKPNLKPSDPSAKLIEGCITGIKRLKPPRGKLGQEAVPPPIQWHPLDRFDVAKPAAPQGRPAAGRDRDIQSVLVKKQVEQKEIFAALEASGFSLTWQSLPVTEIRFRELQADPLVGAVAA
jgi:uncharacterized protein DUF6603